MYYLDLFINFIVTAAMNITPALIIRFLVRKRRFDISKHAIISCIVIAIVVWTVMYAIALSSIGSNIVPKGMPEIIFAFVNYFILKPKTSTATTNIQKENVDSGKNKTSPITDENMKAYADIMLAEESPANEVKHNTSSTRITKVSIALNVLLVIALIGTSVFCFSIKSDLDQTKIELADTQERYERAKKARESMMEQHQEEIDEIINRLNPDKLDYEQERERVLKDIKKNEEKWNRENPDNQISGVMPVD